MTDLESAGTVTEAAPAPVEQSQVQSNETQVSETPKAEKMLPQSHVDKIVWQRTKEVEQRTRDKVLKEFESQNQQATPPQTQSMGGMPSMSPDQLQKMIDDGVRGHLQDIYKAHEQQSRQEQGQQIAQAFEDKLSLARGKYEDFGDVVDSVNFETIPAVAYLAAELDNGGDVVYDLLKNPNKVADILTLAGSNMTLARRSIKQLSDSIRNNQQASNVRSVPDPLRPITPSSVGSDNGNMTVSDYRSVDWLKA